jgi:hypothetical protein
MTTRRHFLTTSAVLPVLCNLQSTLPGSVEVTEPTAESQPGRERQPSTPPILAISHPGIITLILFALVGRVSAQDDANFFRAGFNGAVLGMLEGASLDPTATQGLRFVPSGSSQAWKIEPGNAIGYDLGDTFHSKAGALEIRFRPDFPQTADSPERDVLRLKGTSDFEAVLTFKPVGVRWVFTIVGKSWRKELTLWHGRVKTGQWNHVLFVWNKEENSFAIYHDGKWVETISSDNRFGGPVRLDIGGEHDAGISVDEIALYKRAFTHPQAAFLAETFRIKGDRFDALTKRLAIDDQALVERRALLSRLVGKVGRVYPNRGVEPSQGSYPEGVTGVGIRPEDIGRIDLSQFSVIHFPQGPRFQIDPGQFQHIVDYVKNGGGYVGCCQGAFFAEKLKLVDVKCYAMDVWGLYNIALNAEPHVVKGGRDGTIRMHFGNGPIMVAGKDCEVLGTYALDFFTTGKPAAILTGKCGKGNVVLFGTHPLGEKVSYKGTRAWFSGKLMGTEKMFINALLYAAELVDREGVAFDSDRR